MRNLFAARLPGAPQIRDAVQWNRSHHLLVTSLASLRHDQTEAERRLWSRLRDNQLCDVKFRRQHPVGPYFADFFCQEVELIVELDGSQHADQVDRDELRTEFLRAAGYEVLRFWNNEVISEIDEVLQRIADALEGSRKTKKRRM